MNSFFFLNDKQHQVTREEHLENIWKPIVVKIYWKCPVKYSSHERLCRTQANLYHF